MFADTETRTLTSTAKERLTIYTTCIVSKAETIRKCEINGQETKTLSLLHVCCTVVKHSFILTTTVCNIGTKNTNPLLLQCPVEEAMELM